MPSNIKLPRTSKGKRPHFFEDHSVDHLLAMVVELSAELSVVYSRLDTLERVLEDSKIIDRATLETYQPDRKTEEERAEWRTLFLDRLLRTVRARDEGD